MFEMFSEKSLEKVLSIEWIESKSGEKIPDFEGNEQKQCLPEYSCLVLQVLLLVMKIYEFNNTLFSQKCQ